MEKSHFHKHTFSVSSLLDKTETVTYNMDDNLKKNVGEYYIKEINKLFPEINYFCGKIIFVIFSLTFS
jgi:hypothetical protein